MTYLLQKHKNIVFLTLILLLSFGVWYVLTNRNINTIPEKADLVFTHFSTIGSMKNGC